MCPSSDYTPPRPQAARRATLDLGNFADMQAWAPRIPQPVLLNSGTCSPGILKLPRLRNEH